MSRAATAVAPLVHPTARFDRPGFALLARGTVFLVVMAVALAVLLNFHDRFWWAPGEGAQAIYAERLLNGALRDVPPDAVHWVNALAFKLFGSDLVSLRYPLLALTLIQSALAFWLLAERGVLIAFAAVLALSCLTFVQFLAPVAQWYGLFLCVLIAAVLSRGQAERRGGLELVGFLLALLFLVHPLGGLLAGGGVLTCLLMQEQRHPGRERAVLAHSLVLLMFATLSLYLRASMDVLTAVLFGIGPLLLLGSTFVVTRLADRCVVILLLRLGLGGLCALGPVLAYFQFQGGLVVWLAGLADSFAAPAIFAMAREPGFAEVARRCLEQLLAGGLGAGQLNGLFWLLLLVAPACLGLSLVRAQWQGVPAGRSALPVLACFFALVSASAGTLQGLFFTVALTLAGLLFVLGGGGVYRRILIAAGTLCVAIVGLDYQAGQTASRSWDDAAAGRTRTVVAPLGLPRASLTVAADEAALYGLLINLIEGHSAEGDSILALPANPELAFLSGRVPALGTVDWPQRLRGPEDLRKALAELTQDPPRLLIDRPGDGYNTPAVRRLAESLRGRYRLVETAGGFAVYQLRED